MIKLNNVEKIFRTDEIETMALNKVSFEINAGEFVAIMGPSGCGKSTLLNILGMLDSPETGDYEFNGKNIAKYSEAKLGQLRKENIGFIFQSFNLIDELNVFENIELALLYHDIPSAERKQRVQAVIEKMEIAHRAKHMPSQLSGGQQQRVAVARALVANPKLILADEPTGNLDSARGQEVMSLLKKLNQEGSTIIMVTHSAEHAEYAQRRINLFDGKVVAQSQLSVA
ncbi:MAG: ABC transporter ATP-binding protein [Gammaproteobacteria bacterium]|nr:MAG: ABC transporter ATP-binding protein [Gammaproteobacteria bacterium]